MEKFQTARDCLKNFFYAFEMNISAISRRNLFLREVPRRSPFGESFSQRVRRRAREPFRGVYANFTAAHSRRGSESMEAITGSDYSGKFAESN